MNTSKQIINNHNKRILKSSQHIDYTADNTSTKDTKPAAANEGTHAYVMETASNHY